MLILQLECALGICNAGLHQTERNMHYFISWSISHCAWWPGTFLWMAYNYFIPDEQRLYDLQGTFRGIVEFWGSLTLELGPGSESLWYLYVYGLSVNAFLQFVSLQLYAYAYFIIEKKLCSIRNNELLERMNYRYLRGPGKRPFLLQWFW